MERLAGFEDLDIIGKFAERFSLHPDEVYERTSLDTIANFMVMWKEQAEFNDRYAAVEKEHQDSLNKTGDGSGH